MKENICRSNLSDGMKNIIETQQSAYEEIPNEKLQRRKPLFIFLIKIYNLQTLKTDVLKSLDLTVLNPANFLNKKIMPNQSKVQFYAHFIFRIFVAERPSREDCGCF